MCVVFLTWEVTLYVTLTVSASTRKNHRIEFAECEQSILQSRPCLCSPAKVPNDLDCSVGLWTQQFRQGHHGAQMHRRSKNAPPLQRFGTPKMLRRSTSPTLKCFQNAPMLQCSNTPTLQFSNVPTLRRSRNAPPPQRSNAPPLKRSNASKMLQHSNAPTLLRRSKTPQLPHNPTPQRPHLPTIPTLQRSNVPTLQRSKNAPPLIGCRVISALMS